MKQCACILTIVVVVLLTLGEVPLAFGFQDGGNGTNQSHTAHAGVSLASWNIAYVSPMLEISAFVLLAGLLKIAFHHVPYLPSIIPESCILIIIGIAVGAIIYYGGVSKSFRMETKTFFLFLLPPIVLEASFTLNNTSFRDHIGTILIYAIVGTIINFLIIGFSMFGLGQTSIIGSVEISQLEYLLFGAFIVAVDPVAVLAIFQDIGVNQVLYFLVFGESLLNDAVTIVIYHMMEAFTYTPEINHVQVITGIGSFFTVSLGGLLIGIIFGMAACLLTRVTSHVRVAEPLAILIMAYMSYLCAELFRWSGIISMIGCGIIEAHYAFKNISRKSYVTVLYFIKMLSSCNDSIIFLFLGLELIRTDHVWNTGFICSALLLCLFARIISVFGLTFIVNLFNKQTKIRMADQFIMWYGGLRGAVCFALCNSLDIEREKKNLFLTTTFVVILFTVFVQGITVKPLVKFCKIVRKDESATTLMMEFQTLMFENMVTALDAIVNQDDRIKMCCSFDDKYLKKLLLKKTLSRQEEFIEAYKEMALKRYRSVLGKISEVKEHTFQGMDNHGFYPIDEDFCNLEEDLAKEVEQELKTFKEYGVHGEEISRNDIVNMYRALSRRSLGDTFVFDRDLKYHDIPEEQDREEMERELQKSICEFIPAATSRNRKLSAPIMNRKLSQAMKYSLGAYGPGSGLKGAISMNFDPNYSTRSKQNTQHRYSAYQLRPEDAPVNHLENPGQFYSQPNSPSRRIHSKYTQKRFSRASHLEIHHTPLGEVQEENLPTHSQMPMNSAGGRRFGTGSREPQGIPTKPRTKSESSEDESFVAFSGGDSAGKIDEETKL